MTTRRERFALFCFFCLVLLLQWLLSISATRPVYAMDLLGLVIIVGCLGMLVFLMVCEL